MGGRKVIAGVGLYVFRTRHTAGIYSLIEEAIMAKIIRVFGNILIALSVLFLLASSLIVVSDGHVRKDIFGMTIPTPANWTSFVPYLGFVIGVIFELFSIHGLVVIVITLLLFAAGMKLSNYAGSKKANKAAAPSIIPEGLHYPLKGIFRAYKSGNVTLTNKLTLALGSDTINELVDSLSIENHPRPSPSGRAFDEKLHESLLTSLVEKGYEHDAAQIVIGIISLGLESELMGKETETERSAT